MHCFCPDTLRQVVRPIECDNRDELEGSLDVLDAGDPFVPLVKPDAPNNSMHHASHHHAPASPLVRAFFSY